MFLLIRVIAIVLALICHEDGVVAADVPTWSSVILPVTKHTDAAKPLYSARAYFNNTRYSQQNLLLDVDAPFIWHYGIPYQESCEACPVAMRCDKSQCTDMRTTFSYQDPSCPAPTNSSMYEGYWECELCPVNVIHPVTGLCSQVLPTYDDEFMMNKYNGGQVLSDLYAAFATAACAPPWTFDSFPADVKGVMALSTSLYALPAYIHDPVEKIIALCLPNAADNGVLFLGNGPYFLPNSNVDARSILSYTPLLKHPDSFGYFIGVNSVIIKKRSINVNTSAKISTLDPYTTLRTDIYSNMVRRFSMVTKRIPPAKPVAPFGVCYNTSSIDSTVGIRVPDIDLFLQGGKNWTISTANSIKQVTNDVACLAFVDGGATTEHSIVIGTFQFEDNFLLFNLENSTFGFSSSLLRKKTSCSNFHSSP